MRGQLAHLHSLISAFIYIVTLICHTCRGGSRISGKGVIMYKEMGIRFADFLFSFFLKYPMKNETIWPLLIFKNGGGGGGNASAEPPLDPPLYLKNSYMQNY